ncbi:MAG TPA: PAS domain-containing sensor histidine kinase, partial [Armatimonadota bacterium]
RLYPDTRASWPSQDWPVVRAAREGIPQLDIEQLVVFPDGREVPILVHAAPIIIDGHSVAAVGVAQDLTQLKAADRAKDEFLAFITHELRSPLTTIIAWGSLALEDPQLREEALPIILRNAQAQRRIIDDLLDISRLIYGKLRLEMEAVDAWEVVAETVEGRRREIEEEPLTLHLQPPGEPLLVLADPVRLTQVVNNLLNNAIKFTPPGGTITVEGQREGEMARISVVDTGRGIPPDQLPLIFQRFEQLGRERLSGGLGLGLAVVKGIIDLHGGRVEAFSEGEGQGSRFTFWLPLRRDAGE